MSTSLRHILFIVPSLRGGGAERVVATLLAHLNRSKFRLTLAVVDMRDAIYVEDLPPGISVVDLQSTRVRFAMLAIVKLIYRIRPDVVFSTLGHLNLSLAAIRFLLPRQTRFIARETVVVSENIRNYKRPRWWSIAYRIFYPQLDLVVCQSRDMRDDLLRNFGVPIEKLALINNPVDVVRIQQLAREPVGESCLFVERSAQGGALQLVAAGRLSRQKGFDLLIEAVARCGRTDLQLTILGAGPLKSELERSAAQLGIEDRVRFAGFQVNPYPYFLAADAFVLSSRFEGFPNVLLEALACGTPVVALPCPGGVREILTGTLGCTLGRSVSVGALIELLQGLRKREAIDTAAVVKRFGVANILQEYESVLLVGLPV